MILCGAAETGSWEVIFCRLERRFRFSVFSGSSWRPEEGWTGSRRPEEGRRRPAGAQLRSGRGRRWFLRRWCGQCPFLSTLDL